MSLTKLIQQNSKVFFSHIFSASCAETALIKDAATGPKSCLLNIAKPITKIFCNSELHRPHQKCGI